MHGPLLALGAVETVRRQDPREIARMQYRLVSPAYLGRGTIGFACTRDDSGSLRVVGSQDAVPTVEATFTHALTLRDTVAGGRGASGCPGPVGPFGTTSRCGPAG